MEIFPSLDHLYLRHVQVLQPGGSLRASAMAFSASPCSLCASLRAAGQVLNDPLQGALSSLASSRASSSALFFSHLHLPSRQPYGLVQLGLQQSLWRQLHQILCHSDLAPVELQQLNPLPVLLAAQYQADGRLLSWPALILVQPAQIQLHLALAGEIVAPSLSSMATSRCRLRW